MNIKNTGLFCLISYCFLQTLLLTSCDNGPEPRTRLLFASGNTYTTDSQTVNPGQIITTSVYGEAGGNATLKKLQISYSYDKKDTIIYLDSTLQAKEFGMVFTFSPRTVTGRETWFFTLEDSDNNIYTRQYTLRTTGSTQPFHNFSTVYFKRSALENLRYFNPENGTVYPGYFIRNGNNKAIRDKIAFYLEANPTSNLQVDIKSFNETTFKKTSLKSIGEVNSINAIKAAYDNNGTTVLNTVNNIDSTQVIAFRNKTNRYGLIGNFTFDRYISNQTGAPIKHLRQVKYEVRTEK